MLFSGYSTILFFIFQTLKREMKQLNTIQSFCLVIVAVNFDFTSSNYTESTGYEGAQLLQVTNTNPDAIRNLVEKYFLDLWGHNKSHAQIMIPRSTLSPVKQYLRKNQVPFRIMMDDVQQVVEQYDELAYKNDNLFDDDGKLSMNKYHRLSVIHDYLSSLVELHPETISDGTLGFSWEGRPLKYIKISSGKDDSKAVFIDAGIHAREWISPAAVLYVIRELAEKRDKLPKELLDLDFYVVPVLNPDGYEYTHTKRRLWRKNRSQRGPGCQGIDLNRNFDIYWAGKGTSRHECSQVYVGPAPFSEPESLAIADFLMTIRNLKAYISVHSYSQLLLLPYAYDSVKPSDYDELKETADRAAESMLLAGGEYYQVGTSPDILYPASGSSADWAKAVAGVKFSYTFELRDTGKHGFLLPASQILPTGKELFEAVKVIGAAAARSHD